MDEIKTIEKVNAIIGVVSELNDEDATFLLAARDRIEQSVEGRELDEKDKAGLIRLDSILALYSTIPKK